MTAQSKDGVGNGRNGRSRVAHRRKDTRSRIFRELVHIAAQQGAEIELGVSTGDALQQCLDRAVSMLRFAQDQVDQIIPPDGLAVHTVTDPETGEEVEELIPFSQLPVEEDPLFEVRPNPSGPAIVVRHRWLDMEREARLEVEKLAAMMTQLGIAERVVRVEEAKAALLIAAVREAALRSGLDNDQVRRLGEALRDTVAEGMQDRRPAYHVKEAVPIIKKSKLIEDSLGDDA